MKPFPVHGIDPMACPHWGSKMKAAAFVEPHQAEVIGKILRHTPRPVLRLGRGQILAPGSRGVPGGRAPHRRRGGRDVQPTLGLRKVDPVQLAALRLHEPRLRLRPRLQAQRGHPLPLER